MKLTVSGRGWVLWVAAGLVAGPAAAQEPITVTGVGVQRTIDCDGRRVEITGSDNRLTLRGRCDAVAVSGTHNVVQVEGLGRVSITGINHRVEWEYALRGDQPSVSKSGIGNEVVQVKAQARESAPSGRTTRRGDVVVEGNAEGGGHRVTIGDGGISVDSGGGRSSQGGKGSGDRAGSITVVENELVRSYD